MSETVILFLIGVGLIVTLYIAVSYPTNVMKSLVNKVNQSLEKIQGEEECTASNVWFEGAEYESMRALEKRPEAIHVARRAFDRLNNLLEVWRTDLAAQEVMCDFDDIERLFRISMANIKRICKEYAEDRRTFGSFTREIDCEVYHISELISNLSELADARRRFGYVQ